MNNIHAAQQSGYYRSNQSCKTTARTTTLVIHNDLFCMSDIILKLLLDLTAAFHAIIHSNLIKKIKTLSSVNSSVPNWSESYSGERLFKISINKYVSNVCS